MTRNLTPKRDAPAAPGVAPERIYVDHGVTGTDRDWPGCRLRSGRWCRLSAVHRAPERAGTFADEEPTRPFP